MITASRFVTGDGIRPWHSYFLSVEPENGVGACIWLGTRRKYFEADVQLLYSPLSPEEKYQGLPQDKSIGPREFEQGRIRMHHYDHCGDCWVGIASYPLPECYAHREASWPGKTHLFHYDNLLSPELKTPEPKMV